MKLYCIIVNLILFPILVQAQDIITLKNGDEIRAKVKEVGINDISYQKFDNPTDLTYRVLKSEVFMIKYENGVKEVFNTTNNLTNNNAVKAPSILTDDQKLNYKHGKFRQKRSVLSLYEVEEYMKKSKSQEAYNTFNAAKKLSNTANPLVVCGLVGAIVGTSSVLFLSLIKSVGSSFGGQQDNKIDSYIYTSGAIGVISLATFTYGITIKSNSKSMFKKSADQYNVVF